MKEMARGKKLTIVTDQSGNIRNAMWPGIQSDGAPTHTGMSVPDGQQAHEVDLPKELYEAARPNLGDYVLDTASLVRRSTKAD